MTTGAETIPLADVDIYQDIPVLDRQGKAIAAVEEAWCRGPAHVATWLVVRGLRPGADRRVIAAERVLSAGPDGLVSDLTRADWNRLARVVPDDAIEIQVDEALRYDSGLDELGRRALDVSVDRQHVALRGYVASRRLGKDVVDRIKAIPGVVSVVTDLYADDDLAEAIGKAIAADKTAAAGDVGVQVLNGTVDITGQAPSDAALQAVERAAWTVRGVLAVHNYLTVEPAA